MEQIFSTYIPMDRRQALARGEALPERSRGAALFADISGFTALTELLAHNLGPQRGAEELTYLLNRVYDGLIDEVDRFGGSVIMFSGDAITCWFDDNDEPEAGDTSVAESEPVSRPQPSASATLRAIACALGMQAAVASLADAGSAPQSEVSLVIKVAIAYGPVRRLLVGDPQIQRLDVLAGATLDRLAGADHLAAAGEIVLDAATAEQIDGELIRLAGWRADPASGARVAIVDGLLVSVAAEPWPELPPNAIGIDIAQQWLLPPLVARLRERTESLLADLRPALALFLSFGGIDYDSDDDGGILLDAYVRHVQLTLAHYDGFLLQLTIGDKGSYLCASFGAPIAHDDDAANAIAAAQSLRSPPPRLGFIRNIRIGLGYGQMYAGTYGGPDRRTYGVLGDKTNLAARLMSAAPPGTVWCDEGTYQRARRSWAFEELPAMRVKGRSEVVRAYQPVAPLSAADHLHGTRTLDPSARLESAVIGRVAELAELERVLAALRVRQGGVVLIEGEAGIGKSRLVAELIRQAQADQVRVLLGAGQSIEQQTPYRAWREIFSAYFNLDGASEPAQRQAQVLQVTQQQAPRLLARMPLLNDLLALDVPETPLTEALDPALRRESLVGLLTSLLQYAARQQPLLVVVEDAHWLDSLSWGLALGLARALADDALLLVLTHRPLEEQSTGAPSLSVLQALPGCTRLALAGLDEDGILAVAAQRLGVVASALPAPLAALLRRSGGNPFFAEELLSALRDRNLIRLEADRSGSLRCAIDDDFQAAGVILPDTLQGLILARIDRLPPDRQLTLKIAAVVGYSFAYSPLLATLTSFTHGNVLDLRQQLEHLAQLNLTVLEALEPDLTYIFKHIITQEVAYETLLFSQRRTIHRLVAEWYERSYELAPAGDRRFLPLLVYHFRGAGDRMRQQRYSRLIGEQAAAQSASVEAITYLSQAIELTPEHDLAERYALLRARERVYDLQGARAVQLEDLNAMGTLADALGDAARRAEVALRRSMHASAISDFPTATAFGRMAAELARAAGDTAIEATATGQWGRALIDEISYDAARVQLSHAVALAQASGLLHVAADCLGKLGLISRFQNDYGRAYGELMQALELARRIGDPLTEGKALVVIGQLSVSQGEYEAARALYQEALTIFRTVGDRRRESWAHSTLGDLAISLGNYAAAELSYRETLAIARAIGDRSAESHALNILALNMQKQGNYSAASGYYTQSLELASAIGDRYVETATLANAGLLRYLEGDATGALEYSERVLRVALDAGHQGHQSFAWTVQGHALLQLGRLAEAAEAYQHALDIWRALGETNLVPDPLSGLARVALAQGELDRAKQFVEQILAHLETRIMDGAGEPLLNYLTCYQVLRATHDPRAGEVLEAGFRLLQQRAASLTDPDARAAFIEQIPAHRELAACAGQL